MVVAELMTPKPFVVSVTDSVRSVTAKLMEADVRHLPVVSGKQLVGIVSDRDLRRLLEPMLEWTEGAQAGRELMAQPISVLMSSDVIALYPESSIEEAIDLMLEHKIGAIPVIEPDSSRVVGILSYVDVLRAARPALS